MMARYIDVDRLKTDIIKWLPQDKCGNNTEIEMEVADLAVSMLMTVDEQPTADVQEVVHGKWLNFIGDFSTAECSNCGAKMDGSNDEPITTHFKAL